MDPHDSDVQHAALSPDDEPILLRNAPTGVVRFSSRTWLVIYVVLAVLAVTIGYSFGVFKHSSNGAQALASPVPIAGVATPLPMATSGNEQAGGLVLPSPQPSDEPPLPTLPRASTTTGANASLGNSLDNAAHTVPGTPANTTDGPSSGTIPTPEPLPTNVPQPGSAPEAPTTTAAAAAPAGGGCHPVFVVYQQHGGGCTTDEGATTPPPNGSTPDTPDTSAPTDAAKPSMASLNAAQRIAFAGGDQAQSPYLPYTAIPAASRYELWAGTTIPAQLDTGINSDIPGIVVAHIVEPVFDSQSGRTEIIPDESRLIGRPNTSVTTGQARMQVEFDWLIEPDGCKVDLDNMPSADTEGNAGLYADVNTHSGRIITAAVITGVLSAGAALAQGGQTVSINPVTGQQTGLQPGAVIGESLAQSAANTGQQLVGQQLNQPPTLTVPKGERFLLMLNRTVILPPFHTAPCS